MTKGADAGRGGREVIAIVGRDQARAAAPGRRVPAIGKVSGARCSALPSGADRHKTFELSELERDRADGA